MNIKFTTILLIFLFMLQKAFQIIILKLEKNETYMIESVYVDYNGKKAVYKVFCKNSGCSG